MATAGADNMEDDEKGKLFVGALSWETTDENLLRYFSRFGKVIDCVVMMNSETGRSRGFGFVTYADANNVINVLQSGPHILDGRTIDPKPCNPRSMQKQKIQQQQKKGSSTYPKIFLGGLPSNITETDLRTFFGRYGNVMEVVIMYDQEKKKSRGFGFLSFDDEAAVERVTSEHYINLNGKQVEIKKAEPRDVHSATANTTMATGGIVNVNNNRTVNNNENVSPWNSRHVHPQMSGQYHGSRYQGWGASVHQHQQQQQQLGYPGGYSSGIGSGTSGGTNPQSFHGGWGSLPGPPTGSHHHHQGPPPGIHAWNNYTSTGTQQNQGFSTSYGATANNTASGQGTSGQNWKSWVWNQNSTTTGNTGDMYSSRGGGGHSSTSGGLQQSTTSACTLSSLLGGGGAGGGSSINTNMMTGTSTTKLQANDYTTNTGYGSAPPYGGNYLNDRHMFSTTMTTSGTARLLQTSTSSSSSSSITAAAFGCSNGGGSVGVSANSGQQSTTFGNDNSHNQTHIFQVSQIQGNGF